MAESLAFRLGAAYREKLEEEAKAHGMAVGPYARELVIAALDGRGLVQAELAALRQELSKLRELLEQARGGPDTKSAALTPDVLALRDELLSALQDLPKTLALDSHLVRFMTDYNTAQRELLERNLAALRRDLANAVLALLVGAGKMGSEEANAWVNTHLRRKD